MNQYLDDFIIDTPKKQKKAYVKNQKPEIKNYEQEVNNLMNSKCDYKNIFGYMANDSQDRQVCIKYNKQLELFVCYYIHPSKKIPVKKFSSLKSWREYNSDMYDPSYQFQYVDEIS